MERQFAVISPSLLAARADNYAEAIACVEQAGAQYLHIDVDGGINLETGAQCLLAGADSLVAGSAIFGSKYPADIVSALKGVQHL